MRVPLSWLADFAPIEGDVAALAATLDELGLVVEEIVRVGEGLEDVVVARVEQIAAIHGADRIRRVVVDAGGGPVEVVCGAWNFSEGDLVPLAPVGAVLPGGFEIARRKMKGVVSDGMLCSPHELELSDDHQGILVLGGAARPGMPLTEALGIERDVVFDISVEANRPDAWCVAGVARDLAAKLRLPFAISEPEVSVPDAGQPVDKLASVAVADLDLCPRFTARVLSDVVVGPSPRWLARRLTLAGMRPINNVVDVSNYVMLELGQPNHPYDLDRLPGRGLRVRAARPGETLVTLDGEERKFGRRSVGGGDDLRDGLICDADDEPVGIGGIMGGASSEIVDATSTVLLEVAYFTPMAVARTSKRLALRTEASARFERGCDPGGIDRAAARFVSLLAGCAPAIHMAPGAIDVQGAVPAPRRVRVRTARVNAVLGTSLTGAQVAELLAPIEMTSETASGDPGSAAGGEAAVLDVTVPTFRPDTIREIDVIEEVARLHGYDAIGRRRPNSPYVGSLTRYQRRRRTVRQVVAGLGAHEAWTTSLLAPGVHRHIGLDDGVRLSNPLTPDESELRQDLMPGLLGALAFNAARRQGEVRLFEIGHVFPVPDRGRVEQVVTGHEGTVIDERELLAVAFAAPGDDARAAAAAWYAIADALDVQGVTLANSWKHGGGSDGSGAGVPAAIGGLHPTRRGVLRHSGGAVIGVVGEVDPQILDAFGLDAGRTRVGWLEVDLEALLDLVPTAPPLAGPLSKYPSSDIDLAFVVAEDVSAADIGDTLRETGGELLESVWLFDVYRGPGLAPGARGLTYRLRFCALDRTLTDEEVGMARARCIDAVVFGHGATLRG